MIIPLLIKYTLLLKFSGTRGSVLKTLVSFWLRLLTKVVCIGVRGGGQRGKIDPVCKNQGPPPEEKKRPHPQKSQETPH